VAGLSDATREPADLVPTTEPLPDSPIPAWVSTGRVPCLDGLRAVSIGLVLFAHSVRPPGSPFAGYRRFAQPAAVGVDVFFVISGFLITLLLLREHDRTGRVSLRGFYTRRALRILPAYLALLAFVAVLAWTGAISPRPIDWVAALTYTTNFVQDRCWDLGHAWSLSVEEHFYLAWPAVLLLLGPRRGLVLLAVALFAAPAIRVGLWKLAGPDPDFLNYVTPTRYEAIGYGCLLAFAARHPLTWRVARRVAPVAGLGVLAVAGLIAASEIYLCRSWKFTVVPGRTSAAVLITAGVFLCLAAPRSLVARALELRLVVLVGVLSYSLYLWQQPFLKDSPAWWCRWPQCLVLAVAAAVACHLLVERPFLRLKARASAEPRPGPAAPPVPADPAGSPGNAEPGPLDGRPLGR
jgi:peptidoglycan/LPS O-acetylase OafA/YrhL